MDHSKCSLILSIGSDIGLEYANRKISQGARVYGTYRRVSNSLKKLEVKGAGLFYCDFTDRSSVQSLVNQIVTDRLAWNELIVCPGTLEPIGRFHECDFYEWERSIEANLLGPLHAIHGLVKMARVNASVILFAGGGTNGTADDFSAYTMSKIALIKMTELLDSEIPEIKFSIIGPGWIRTKIHEETLGSKERCISAYAETIRRLEKDEFGSMDELMECMEWTIKQTKAVVGGRNISSQFDCWKSDLSTKFSEDGSLGKLRRFGNERLSR